MKEKIFRNSPKGRSKIPEKAGEYKLLDIHGNDINDGGYWEQTDNLKYRIHEHHYDKSKHFKFIKIRRGKKK